MINICQAIYTSNPRDSFLICRMIVSDPLLYLQNRKIISCAINNFGYSPMSVCVVFTRKSQLILFLFLSVWLQISQGPWQHSSIPPLLLPRHTLYNFAHFIIIIQLNLSLFKVWIVVCTGIFSNTHHLYHATPQRVEKQSSSYCSLSRTWHDLT